MGIVKQGKIANLQSVKSLIAENQEWAPKLKRSLFSDVGIQRALKELADLFPATLGSKINGA
ncbi:MAG: hypothetical protein BMS9Abin06_0301 [Gammaproteobacteria bacterium]|nr:MAG: hypothetical protein BMS9Abin06_0301 [Gammaproteobacteria bacterium]